MIPVEQARRLVVESVRPLEPVELDPAEALGLVTTEPLFADRDYPPTDRSAMDGFAVRATDVPRAGTELEIAGEAPAGAAVDGLAVAPGTALRIFTGAIVPRAPTRW